jgi:hypothetical protein
MLYALTLHINVRTLPDIRPTILKCDRGDHSRPSVVYRAARSYLHEKCVKSPCIQLEVNRSFRGKKISHLYNQRLYYMADNFNFELLKSRTLAIQ